MSQIIVQLVSYHVFLTFSKGLPTPDYIVFLEKQQFFFYAQQFGIREKHSTELATIHLILKISNAIEGKEFTLGNLIP